MSKTKKYHYVFRIGFVAVLSILHLADHASAESSNCEVKGQRDRKVFVYCPSDLTNPEVIKQVLTIREKTLAAHDAPTEKKDVSIYVFSESRSPASVAEMNRLSEARLQKIQTAAYLDYPNGETDFFCKKNGKFQKCNELLPRKD